MGVILAGKCRVRPERFRLNYNSPLWVNLECAWCGDARGWRSRWMWDSGPYGRHAYLWKDGQGIFYPDEFHFYCQELKRCGFHFAKVTYYGGKIEPLDLGSVYTLACWYYMPDGLVAPEGEILAFGNSDDKNVGWRKWGTGATGDSYHIIPNPSGSYYTFGLGTGPYSMPIGHTVIRRNNTFCERFLNGYVQASGTNTNTNGISFTMTFVVWRADSSCKRPLLDLMAWRRLLTNYEIASIADPDNVLMEVGGIPLIQPLRTYWPGITIETAGPTFKPHWAANRKPVLIGAT